MLPGLLAGTAVGLGLYLVLRGLFPGPPPLATTLARLERPGPPEDPDVQALDRALHRLALRCLRIAGYLGLDLETVRRDLRAAGRSLERHAVDKLLVAVTFALLPAAVGLLLTLARMRPPWALIALASLALAVVGFVVPDLTLRSDAARRRREFRDALSAYLDLVVIVMAGGGGTETALTTAAAAGDGWAFMELQQVVEGSRLAGAPPWPALARLGHELGVPELGEMAASITLAGEHGARVRGSLAAKADSLREHRLAESEAAAQEATEKMAVPVVLMLFGFLLFILYPATQHVFAGL